MRSRPRLSLLVTFTALSLLAACSAAQQSAFNHAMTGNSDTSAGGVPTATSVEGVTGQVASGAAVVAGATTGTPASGIAAIIAAAASALLLAERAAVGISGALKNLKGSPSLSSSASGGGLSSNSGAQSSSIPLKPAA